MNARSILLTLLLFIWASSTAHAQGYAGLGTKADEGFAKVQPGNQISFPKDHGAHGDYRIEWWYVTANLEDEKGEPLGLQWTLFRNALKPEKNLKKGWQSRQFWLGHSAITTSNIHLSAEVFARGGVGQAGVKSSPFSAWIDNWSITSKAAADSDPLSALQMQASGKDYSYTVKMEATSPLIRHGNNGYSQKSNAGQASYYYSQPFYEVSGTVTIKGVQRTVTGKAWLDREWSSQPLAKDQTGWDWFSLHFKDGSKLMIFRLRQKDGSHYYSGSRIFPDSKVSLISGDQVSFTPISHHTVADREIPTSWQITLKNEALTFRTKALNPQSWMDNSFGYWEGPIEIEGDVIGVGYLEMTGY